MEGMGHIFIREVQATSWNLKNAAFPFSQDSPGTRASVDSSESPFQLLKKGVETTSFSADDLPQILRPEGLSKDRVQYLKKEVQPFVRPEFRETLFSSLK
jgi:hypothetical protein